MTDAQRFPAGRTAPRQGVPLAGLSGFLVLLAVLFAVAYAVGSAAGPVAPGLHPGQSRSAGGGNEDSGGMNGMNGMGGMQG